MYKPPHPGEVLRDRVLRKDGGITLTELPKQLDAPRVALSRVVNGKAAVSAGLAIRLAAALRGSPETWLRMQIAYELWHAQRSPHRKVSLLENRACACRSSTAREDTGKSRRRKVVERVAPTTSP